MRLIPWTLRSGSEHICMGKIYLGNSDSFFLTIRSVASWFFNFKLFLQKYDTAKISTFLRYLNGKQKFKKLSATVKNNESFSEKSQYPLIISHPSGAFGRAGYVIT